MLFSSLPTLQIRILIIIWFYLLLVFFCSFIMKVKPHGQQTETRWLPFPLAVVICPCKKKSKTDKEKISLLLSCIEPPRIEFIYALSGFSLFIAFLSKMSINSREPFH